MNLFELFGTISINSSVADQTIDDTMDKVTDLKEGLDGVETQSKKTGKSLGKGSALNSGAVWLGNVATKFTNFAANIGKAIVKTGFGFDASMEAYRNQFEALLNDADKANQLVADLQTLAKVSPLGMEGLANNAVSLLNTGTKLADIIPELEMLGNLSLGDTNKMNSVVRAYTQILSKGQLMAQEMYQLGDAGIPVREIMTLYGGERYADGSWYQQKMADPKYKIPAEDMVKAFRAATEEGGKWHDYMFKMMDTWNGQVDRLGEEGKETLGAMMNPFFDTAKTEALPRITESLQLFGTFISENQDALAGFAETLGKIAANSFDSLLSFFAWCVENKDAVSVALTVIGGAIAVIATNAHPILAIVGALSAIVLNWNSIVEWLQPAIDKWNALVGAIDNATRAVQNFLGINRGTGVHISTSGRTYGGAAGKSFGDTKWNAEGAIFSKPTIFNTRLGLQGVGEAGAEAVAPIDKLQQYVADAVKNTVGGMQFNIVLDSGALVGQLAPRMDQQLGRIASRKGRG